MQKQELLKFWSEGQLKVWDEPTLRGSALPLQTRAFLCEIGLPDGVDWTLRFDNQQFPQLPGRNQYRVIGHDDVVPICIDLSAGGRLVAVESDVGGGVRYINSDVEHFAECLVYYQQYRIAARTTDESEIQDVIDSTAEKMKGADPTAFVDPNSYWPVVVEQMNQGLL
jgi:SUKH-4 immunity protein